MSDQNRTRVVRPSDEEWPAYLGELGAHPSPEELFVRGGPIRWGERAVAIVGTRRPSASGVQAARMIAGGLAEAGFAIVSGLAVGIDSVAHMAALDAGGYSLAVLGCGLDFPYPKANLGLKERILEAGTMVSEYPDETSPQPGYFPARNRIIAGLCAGTVVVEGGYKSGALITARIALDANRSVFALPGSIRNPMAAAPNELIRTSQASLVTHFKHITDDLAPGLVWATTADDKPLAKPIALDEREHAVLALLEDTPLSVEFICKETDLNPGEVALALSRLEVRSLAIRRYGGYELSDAGARAKAGR
ncbi:MAG: DNA-processing protein DprA [Actinomycetota bacterium]